MLLLHQFVHSNQNYQTKPYTIPNQSGFDAQLKTWQALPDNVHSSHGAQLTALLDSMVRDERPLVSGLAARGTIEFLASLYKSAMTGEPVRRGSIQPGDPFYERMCGPCDQSWQRS